MENSAVDSNIKNTSNEIGMIIQEIERELINIYEDKLQDLILFGSYARGDNTSSSDIDLLLLLDDMKDINTERKKYFPVISDLSLKYDLIISIIPLCINDFNKVNTPLILNVKKDRIKI